MKWRSLLLVSFATIALFISSFSTPKHVFAQTTNTYDSFFDETKSLFDNTINGVSDVCSKFTQSKDYKDTCSVILPLLNSTKDVYVASFNADKSEGTTPVKAQVTALNNATRTFSSGRPTPLVLGKAPGVSAIIQTFEGQLRNFSTVANSMDRNGSNTSGATTNATAPKVTADEIGAPGKCSFFRWTIVDCLDLGLTALIKIYVLQIAGFFLWVAANLLDYVINIGILGFSDWAPVSLYPLWQTVRQIVSMFVVFSGLYLGFMYIINKGKEFERYIPWIVIFGLFVNFSYPVTKAAIDVSNIISLNIYASALGTTSTLTKTDKNKDTAGAKIMTTLGLQGLIMAANSVDNTTRANNDIIAKINTTPAMVLIVVYVTYATYIFFIASGLLMIRTIALSFIIVASPILLIDAVIPKLGDLAQKLRKILFEQLSVSVVFMIMLYLSISMTSVFKNLGTGGPTSSTTGTNMTQIFNVIMMLILLHIMIKVTKSVSGSIGQMGTDAIGKFGGFAAGAAIGVASGGAGLLLRSTVGKGSANWVAQENAKAKNGEASAHDSWFGRQRLALANSMGGASFDASKSSTVMGIAGNMGGLGKGLAFTGGGGKSYNQAKEDYDKETEKQASMMSGKRRADYIASRGGTIGKTLYGYDSKDNKDPASYSDQDKDTVKKYANASDDVRETMRKDYKNRGFIAQFDKIEKFLDKNSGLSEAERNAFLTEQKSIVGMQEILKKQRKVSIDKDLNKNKEQVAEFFNASDEVKEDIISQATDESEKKMYLELQKYQSLDLKTEAGLKAKVDILKKLSAGGMDDAVIRSIIANDKDELLNTKGNDERAKEVRKTYLTSSATNQTPNQSQTQTQTQTSSNQTTQSTPSSTTQTRQSTQQVQTPSQEMTLETEGQTNARVEEINIKEALIKSQSEFDFSQYKNKGTQPKTPTPQPEESKEESTV